MADSNEIEALKASFRGALGTAAALAALEDRVLALDPRGDIPAEDLDELGRVTLAHAVSSQALRGLIESIRARRT
jgi:HAMP domain-containing protein